MLIQLHTIYIVGILITAGFSVNIILQNNKIVVNQLISHIMPFKPGYLISNTIGLLKSLEE